MPPQEERVVKLRFDTTQAERDLTSMAHRATGMIESRFNRYGQMAAFGIAGYGAYRLYQSQFGQGAVNVAFGALDNVRSATGFSPVGMTMQPQGHMYQSFAHSLFGAPVGYDGVNMNPAAALHYGGRDAGQRVGAGLVGALTGTGLTAGMFAGGWALSRLGLLAPINAGFRAVGTAAGGAVMGGVTNLAGRAIGASLRGLGFNRAADAVGPIFNYLGAGAASAGRVVGGLIGSMAPLMLGGYAVSIIGQNIAGNVSNFREIQDELDRIGYRYTYGTATNLATGRGFGARDQQDIARAIRRRLLDEDFMRQVDFSEIFRGLTDSELDFNVRSAEEFKDKFAKVVNTVKEIARTFETSLEGAVTLLGDMQRSGFYTTAEQSAMLFRTNALARASAMRPEQMVALGLSGAEQARAYGFEGAFGSNLRTSLASVLRMRPDFIDSPADRLRFESAIQELGGVESVSGEIVDLFLRLADTEEAKIALYGAVDVDTGTIDRAALDDIMAGRLNFAQMLDRGMAKISRDQRAFELFRSESDRYFSMLQGSDSIAFFGSLLRQQQQMQGLEDMRSLLARLGVDNQLMRYLIDESVFGGAMRSEGAMMTEELQRVAMAESALHRTPRGIWERFVAKPWERMMAGISEPFVNLFGWVGRGFEDFYNEHILRMGVVNIDPQRLGLEGVLEGQRLMENAEAQFQLLRDQERVITALSDSIASFAFLDWNKVSQLTELRTELEQLFDDFNRGKVDVAEFRERVSTLTQTAADGSDALRVAIERLVANEAGLRSVSDFGSIMAAGLRDAMDARAMMIEVFSVREQNTLLGADASRALDRLIETAWRQGAVTGASPVITQGMFDMETRDLSIGQRAAVMARLLEADRSGTIRVEPWEGVNDLYFYMSRFGNMSENMSREIDEALYNVLTGNRQGPPLPPGSTVFDIEGVAPYRMEHPGQTARLFDNMPFGEVANFLFGWMFPQDQQRTMDIHEGRNRFVQVFLNELPSGVVKDALSRFFETSLESDITGTRYNVGNIVGILRDLDISDPKTMNAILHGVGRVTQALHEFGYTDEARINPREIFRNYATEVYKEALGSIHGLLSGVSQSDLESALKDPGFVSAIQQGLRGIRENRFDITTAARSGLTGALATTFDQLMAGARTVGTDRLDEMLSQFEQARLVSEYDSISNVMSNRLSALSAMLSEASAQSRSFEQASIFEGASERIKQFVRGGTLSGVSSLYDDQLIRALEIMGLREESMALQIGKDYWSKADPILAREEALRQLEYSGLFGAGDIATIRGYDKEQFSDVLQAAITTVLQRSALGAGGPQSVYVDQASVSGEVFGRIVGDKLDLPLSRVADTNDSVASAIRDLNSKLDMLEMTLRRNQTEQMAFGM